MFLVLLWFHLIDILYGTVFKLMVLSSAVEPDPVGPGTFWPGRIWMWNNFTGFGYDLLTRKYHDFCNFFLENGRISL
jgi:hypothetical protein